MADKKPPRGNFALPAQKAYPLNTPGRRKLAPSAASRAERVGNITPAQEKTIDRKAAAARKAHGEGGTTAAGKPKTPAKPKTTAKKSGGVDHAREAVRLDLAADRSRARADHHRAMAKTQALKSGGPLQMTDYGSLMPPMPAGVVKAKKST